MKANTLALIAIASAFALSAVLHYHLGQDQLNQFLAKIEAKDAPTYQSVTTTIELTPAIKQVELSPPSISLPRKQTEAYVLVQPSGEKGVVRLDFYVNGKLIDQDKVIYMVDSNDVSVSPSGFARVLSGVQRVRVALKSDPTKKATIHLYHNR